MSTPNRPLYQHYLGNPIAKPPCRMLNALMYGFFITGSKTIIQDYVDNTLNAVKSPDFSFKALSDQLLLTFTDIANIASKVAPFADYGWMQETDIIVWVPIAKVCRKTDDMLHLYWYPAFIAVNNINALVNGRATWGYNKYLCRYEMPTLEQSPDKFSVELETFHPFSPDTKMAWHRLLEITREAGKDSWFKEIAELGEEVAHFFHQANGEVDATLPFLKQMLRDFVHPQMDQILFKQFPDGEAKHAVYQAVVHSPSSIKKIHKIGLLRDKFTLTLHPLDAFPLDQMFGIALGQQEPGLAFYVKMDFDQDPAFEIAVRGA
ncbi:acetoacetate decarboxylase [Pseudoalteromonas fenneropenaei]|uniref:Acetoacetate decarboxylase n=1 Tax=Pseudoalteromonas fenneropenaei TaxID=1737459 RepID=A0ABV7CF35_9GAMM